MAIEPFDETETVKPDLGWAGALLMIASGAAVMYALTAIVSYLFNVF